MLLFQSDSDPEHQAKDRFRLPVIEKRQLFGIRSMTADFLQETRAITSDGEESLSDVSMPSSPDDDPLKRTIVPRQSSIFKVKFEPLLMSHLFFRPRRRLPKASVRRRPSQDHSVFRKNCRLLKSRMQEKEKK